MAIGGLSRIDVCLNDNCVKENCEIDPDTGVYEEGCEFYPNKDQDVHESIMYSQTLDPVKITNTFYNFTGTIYFCPSDSCSHIPMQNEYAFMTTLEIHLNISRRLYHFQ